MPLENIFTVLLKMHKTAICSPKGLEAAIRGAKKEIRFISDSSSLRKSLWKVIFFYTIPQNLLGFVSEMLRKFFCAKPTTRSAAVHFGGSMLFSKSFATRSVCSGTTKSNSMMAEMINSKYL